MSTAHQVLTDFWIASRLATQDSPPDCAVHQEGGLMYIRLEDPEVLSSVERIYSPVGHIWTAISQGGFDQDALQEAHADRTVVRTFVEYCRGITYAQRRVLGRTIKNMNDLCYMDIGWGNIFEFDAEETVTYHGITIFKRYSRGGRVI